MPPDARSHAAAMELPSPVECPPSSGGGRRSGGASRWLTYSEPAAGAAIGTQQGGPPALGSPPGRARSARPPPPQPPPPQQQPYILASGMPLLVQLRAKLARKVRLATIMSEALHVATHTPSLVLVLTPSLSLPPLATPAHVSEASFGVQRAGPLGPPVKTPPREAPPRGRRPRAPAPPEVVVT